MSGSKGGGGVAHSVAHNVGAHKNISFLFIFLQINTGFTNLKCSISEPAGISNIPDLPCRQSYSDIQKKKKIKEQFYKLIDYDFLHDLNTLSSETWIKCIRFI